MIEDRDTVGDMSTSTSTSTSTVALADDRAVIRRLLDHIHAGTTDLGPERRQEPVPHYVDAARFADELALLRRRPTIYAPSALLPEAGSYLAREVLGVPLVVMRGSDGAVRAFRNVCRHRGMQVVDGAGCQRVHTCPYHGWSYGLEGELRHVPHDDGFPGLDRGEHGLVSVAADERHGLIFVSIDGDATPDAAFDEVAGFLDDCPRANGPNVSDERCNWKVLADTFLEGYHIRALHHDTFYPEQYDNVNVVEPFGAHCRIAFPYRTIERLADRPPEQWTTDAKLTYVYQLFPNAMLATFPGRKLLFVLEPTAVDRTTMVTFAMTPDAPPRPPRQPRRASADGPDLVALGGAQDFVAARAVQRGLTSGTNEHLEFGRNESGLIHFHQQLDAAL
jgi:phenylpropionate dioxygenase-like ring-hydroxylating dioxygenase large terminal subunit